MDEPNLQNNLLTIREVAERLSVSQQCVYRLVESGRLLAHRIGNGRGTLRIGEDDLTSYLSSTRTQPCGPEPRQSKLKHIQF